MAGSALKLSYADLLAFPEDGKRHELIDGEHGVSAAPTLRHQAVLLNLFLAVHGFVQPRRLGEVFFAPVDVVLSDHDVIQPDLLSVRRQRLAIPEERFAPGAPDLGVGVTPAPTRKTEVVVKRRAFRQFGLGEFWLVDPAAETVEVFRGGDW